MAVLPIAIFPDKVLLQPAAPVEQFDAKLVRLLTDMAETMYVSDGIGLAAPQVNRSVRVVVIDVAPKEEQGKHLVELINPRVTASSGKIDYDEGCLSFPGLTVTVQRPERVTVAFLDRTGQPQQMDAEGLLAVCLQHEIDHCDGITMVDRVNAVTRRLKLREFSRLRRVQG